VAEIKCLEFVLKYAEENNIKPIIDLTNYKRLEKQLLSGELDYLKTDKPKIDDLVIFKGGKYGLHLGIFKGNNKMLHFKNGEVIGRLNKYNDKIIGVYKWRQ